jgi:hypothetical protein
MFAMKVGLGVQHLWQWQNEGVMQVKPVNPRDY